MWRMQTYCLLCVSTDLKVRSIAIIVCFKDDTDANESITVAFALGEVVKLPPFLKKDSVLRQADSLQV